MNQARLKIFKVSLLHTSANVKYLSTNEVVQKLLYFGTVLIANADKLHHHSFPKVN